ncbi:HAMP domain-containing sensor histidine kinase [Clostridium sediminicola]|uniref:HAMP domain-containing sensor histidine kinase n=1 Tax=Clostridium sediminicola TaxID=3114879 RepID=UPI0031F2111E
MKRKLMISIISTMVISLITVTLLFVALINFKNEENIKKELRMNNQIIINNLKLGLHDFNNDYSQLYKQTNIRVTIIDKFGFVIVDSEVNSKYMENHNNRQEIIDARKIGYGSSIRYSETLKKRMVYFTSQYDEGIIIRSSMAVDVITGLEGQYLKYYLLILVFVFVLSLIISSKLSYVIVKPIKDLETTTSKIAAGYFDNRASKFSNDEIGHLAITFNKMADRLQLTIRDSIDKRDKLEAILKSMDGGVIAVDNEKKIIMLNPYARKIFGIDDIVIGLNIEDIIEESILSQIFDPDSNVKEIKIDNLIEKNLKVKTADIISENLKIGTVAVIYDITDIRRLENMRSQFVANVSHELKTPLTSIKGFSETLKYVDDKETKDKFLNIINDETDRLTRLINDILTLSDIEQYGTMKNSIDFEVNKVIDEVYTLTKPMAKNKKILLVKTIEGSPLLYGNPDSFKQMVINLVDNAIKYSENGGTVYIHSRIEGFTYVISIKDTGIGIPNEHIPRLFERFYRVDKARSRDRGGTGLGLAIVKHIVISFGGKILVNSNIGIGSEFIIEIPIDIK